ncbi:hypothetical protein llap_332 [Limosa lapponica baueri]|uniref:Uncharacterized protein n=1 Tax=Limosa lapponica baueri TaxID=1758121 RepID=A0A2I0UTB1_LIMLA|nr:hypothetical protein llap_332 [Limosa lapponica baueri]
MWNGATILPEELSRVLLWVHWSCLEPDMLRTKQLQPFTEAALQPPTASALSHNHIGLSKGRPYMSTELTEWNKTKSDRDEASFKTQFKVRLEGALTNLI